MNGLESSTYVASVGGFLRRTGVAPPRATLTVCKNGPDGTAHAYRAEVHRYGAKNTLVTVFSNNRSHARTRAVGIARAIGFDVYGPNGGFMGCAK